MMSGLIGARQSVTANGSTSFTFEYSGEQLIGLVFANETAKLNKVNGDSPVWSVDNITVTTVPEPATMLLLGLGGMMLRRRRRA